MYQNNLNCTLNYCKLLLMFIEVVTLSFWISEEMNKSANPTNDRIYDFFCANWTIFSYRTSDSNNTRATQHHTQSAWTTYGLKVQMSTQWVPFSSLEKVVALGENCRAMNGAVVVGQFGCSKSGCVNHQ